MCAAERVADPIHMVHSSPAAEYAAHEAVLCMLIKGLQPSGVRVLVLGLIQPADSSRLSTREVVEFVQALSDFGPEVDVFDPDINPMDIRRETGLNCLTQLPPQGSYNAIVLTAVRPAWPDLDHAGPSAFGLPDAVMYDLHHALHADASQASL